MVLMPDLERHKLVVGSDGDRGWGDVRPRKGAAKEGLALVEHRHAPGEWSIGLGWH